MCNIVSLIFHIETILCEQELAEMQFVWKPSAEETAHYDKGQGKYTKADGSRVETEIRNGYLGDNCEYGWEYENWQRIASQIM